MIRVAVDAMGGDTAPMDPVSGGLSAARANSDILVQLVGDRNVIEQECARRGGLPENATIVHASEYVGMNEGPVEAFRRKKDTSIAVAAGLVADRESDAVISAGNTGASVVASTLKMKMVNGVKRPGIAVPMPTVEGVCAILDVGANIKCRPEHLVQYAYMGAVYAKAVLNIANPRVGLLNIGEEDEKGNDLVRITHERLEASKLNFIGNIEGREIFLGRCDVAVCEGFVGNVLLKVAEGMGESLFKIIEAGVDPATMERLQAVKARIMYDEYGGAPLLGTDGVCVICHGRSNDKAIHNAVVTAARFVRQNVVGKIAARVAEDRES